jgi:hypothetical protein
LQKFLGVAAILYFGSGNGQTSRSMTGLTVDFRQPGGRIKLFTMNGGAEIVINIVVFVALGQTLLIADVVSIKTADDEFFIFSDRQQGIVRAYIDTRSEEKEKEKSKEQGELAQWSLLFFQCRVKLHKKDKKEEKYSQKLTEYNYFFSFYNSFNQPGAITRRMCR